MPGPRPLPDQEEERMDRENSGNHMPYMLVHDECKDNRDKPVTIKAVNQLAKKIKKKKTYIPISIKHHKAEISRAMTHPLQYSIGNSIAKNSIMIS